MKKIYIEEILDCSADMIKKIHNLNIYTVDDLEKNIYKIYSLFNSKSIFDQYKNYKNGNKVLKYKELPESLKGIYIHQLPIEKRIKSYIIAIGVETFEELHILIQKNMLKYRVSKVRYNYIMNIYNYIINNKISIKQTFTNDEYASLNNLLFDSVQNLFLDSKIYNKINIYNIKTIRDLAIFIEKYDNIPYFDDETRIEIIEKIKEYIKNKTKILVK